MQKKLTTAGEIEVVQEVLKTLKEICIERKENFMSKSVDYNQGFMDADTMFTSKFLDKFGLLDEDMKERLSKLMS